MSFSTAIRHSLWIAHKDLLEFSRNRILLVMLFVFPLFMMAMFGYIFPSGNSIKDMPVAIVNLDVDDGSPGNESLLFIKDFEAINDRGGYFKIRHAGTEKEAMDEITRGDRSGAVIIGRNFTSKIASGQQGEVTVMYDQSKPQISSQMMALLDSVIARMGTVKAVSTVNSTTGLDMNTSAAIVTPYLIQNKGTVSGDPSYFQFLAPGMMMMVVMFSVMLGLPRAISHEKEAGTFDGILAAPTSRFSIIMGKTMAQSVRGIVQGSVVLILAIILFGVVIHGSILLVFALLLLGIFSFIGIGIAITAGAKDEETAQTFMMILQFPMMFLSGIFFPVEQMPVFLQYASKVLPLTYAAQAMRKVVVLGAGVDDILLEIGVMTIFGIVMLAVAIPLFKRAMTR
ncbi:MAG: ABC transporter permease [Candidatus Thermoplasmatota archaeon]|nr:ABC transporter permease [Candidatus Thermoplasmatota archaeon]